MLLKLKGTLFALLAMNARIKKYFNCLSKSNIRAFVADFCSQKSNILYWRLILGLSFFN